VAGVAIEDHRFGLEGGGAFVAQAENGGEAPVLVEIDVNFRTERGLAELQALRLGARAGGGAKLKLGSELRIQSSNMGGEA